MPSVDSTAIATTPRIRPARMEDLPALYQVCVQTGDGGADATGRFSDPAWLGHRFVGPYVALEPGFSWTLEDEAGPCGYVLGTADSLNFSQHFESDWYPRVAADLDSIRRAVPIAPSDLELEQRRWFEDRRWEFPQPLEEFPAHLHIDLLPRAQGRGFGVRLVGTLLDAMRAARVTGVHLVMHPDNDRARHFYQKLGFRTHTRSREAEVLVRDL